MLSVGWIQYCVLAVVALTRAYRAHRVLQADGHAAAAHRRALHKTPASKLMSEVQSTIELMNNVFSSD